MKFLLLLFFPFFILSCNDDDDNFSKSDLRIFFYDENADLQDSVFVKLELLNRLDSSFISYAFTGVARDSFVISNDKFQYGLYLIDVQNDSLAGFKILNFTKSSNHVQGVVMEMKAIIKDWENIDGDTITLKPVK